MDNKPKTNEEILKALMDKEMAGYRDNGLETEGYDAIAGMKQDADLYKEVMTEARRSAIQEAIAKLKELQCYEARIEDDDEGDYVEFYKSNAGVLILKKDMDKAIALLEKMI